MRKEEIKKWFARGNRKSEKNITNIAKKCYFCNKSKFLLTIKLLYDILFLYKSYSILCVLGC